MLEGFKFTDLLVKLDLQDCISSSHEANRSLRGAMLPDLRKFLLFMHSGIILKLFLITSRWSHAVSLDLLHSDIRHFSKRFLSSSHVSLCVCVCVCVWECSLMRVMGHSWDSCLQPVSPGLNNSPWFSPLRGLRNVKPPGPLWLNYKLNPRSARGVIK